MTRADANHRMWHQRDPDQEYRLKVNYPDEMMEIGEAKECLYWSNKWKRRCVDCSAICEVKVCRCGGDTIEAVGVYELFRHKHTDPVVYVARTQKHGIYTDTARLLGVRDFRGRIPIAELGFCDEITWRRPDGRMESQHFGKRSAVLLGTENRKTLVIVSKRGQCFMIAGGRMRITEWGIVH